MSASRSDRTIGLAVLALAVFLTLLPLLIGSEAEAAPGSVAANDEHGRRALCLLARELGFAPEVWSQPPGRLPRGEHMLWLASAPKSWNERRPKRHALLHQETEEQESSNGESDKTSVAPDEHEIAPTSNPNEKEASTRDDKPRSSPDDKPAIASVDEKESDAQDSVPNALGVQALSNYRQFVEEGGTLMMRFDQRGKRFLCERLVLENLCDLELDPDAPAGARRVHTESGEELEVDWPKGATFRGLRPNGPVRALWTAARSDGERDEVLAVVAPVGNGRLVLLGDDAFLDNGTLGLKDHALLAVRLAEHLRPGGRLLFDEFALGLWQPPTVTGLATSPALFLVTAHLILCALLFVWAKAWVSTFPRDPEALERLSPLSRARARAALYERAGRRDLLAGMLRRGSVRRWLSIAHLRRTRVDAEAPARDANEPSSPELLETEIARIARTLGKSDKSERWREIAVRRRVRNAADLDLLQRDLESIEIEIETPAASGGRRPSARAG